MKNAISNREIWNQCKIKQCNIETNLIVQYYISPILNSATVTFAVSTSTTATSTIW